MKIEKLPVYVNDLKVRAAKKKKGDDANAKLLVISGTIQPFGGDEAELLVPGVKSKVFGRDGGPTEDFKKLEVAIHAPYHFVASFFRVPDNVRPQVKVENVVLQPTLVVRKDKETSAYAASLTINFPCPDDDTAKDLLWLVKAVNTQLWLSLMEQQGSLVDAAEAAEEDEPEGE